jgi:hypothetical protein
MLFRAVVRLSLGTPGETISSFSPLKVSIVQSGRWPHAATRSDKPPPTAAGMSPMALLTPLPIPLLSPYCQRVSSPSLLAAGAVIRPLICLSPHNHRHHDALYPSVPNVWPRHRRRRRGAVASVDQEESSASETAVAPEEDLGPPVSSDAAAEDGVATSAQPAEASPEDLENIREIKRVRCFQPSLSRFASLELVHIDFAFVCFRC